MTDPYEALGLPRGASLREIEQAYQRLRGLYAEDTLATYSLLPDEERRARLQEIEQAFCHLVATHAPPPARHGNHDTAADVGPAPDMELAPGSYLRWLRERAGLSVRDVAERTKIGTGKIDAIERQRFDLLPPPVYLRGFVFEYARCFGVPDPRHLAELYLRHHPGGDEH